MKKLPSISIVTCTYTSNLPLFKKVLESIKAQKYPKELIEHIVMDGGSKDGTVELAKKYGCKVYSDPAMKEFAEERASIGIKKAKNELVIFIENDNILPTKMWFREMVLPFQENKNIICTFSAYNTFEKNMSDVTKYCALFGIPDPTLYYLGRTEKIRMDQRHYDKGTMIKETPGYWVVRFDQRTLPTLGDNGHMFRKRIMNKVNKDPNTYVHVDAFKELLDLGYDTFGVVKNGIVHVASPTMLRLVKQRVNTKQKFFDERRGKRKYLIMDWRSPVDLINLFKYVFFALTIVVPLFESIRGYLRIKDGAWFLHPVICFLMVIGYGTSEIKWLAKKVN